MAKFLFLRRFGAAELDSEWVKSVGFRPAYDPLLEWVGRDCDNQLDSFSEVAAFIGEHLTYQTSVVVIVSNLVVDELNPLAETSWSALIAMLVLAFPEVHWRFLLVEARSARRWSRARMPPLSSEEQGLVHLVKGFYEYNGEPFNERGPALFDGYGLRRVVLECVARGAQDGLSGGGARRYAAPSFPLRRSLAVVLDDETDFSLFEALMAYSRGFRVHAIGSWQEADYLLGDRGMLLAVPSSSADDMDSIQRVRALESAALLLSVEDFHLSFPDQVHKRVSQLEVRAEKLPVLSLGECSTLRRRFVTSGYVRQVDSSCRDQRRQHLEELRRIESQHGPTLRKDDQVLHKPASGIYTLWEELGLSNAFANPEGLSHVRGSAPGFVWPPAEFVDDEEGDGHSAPGRLQQIARHLLDRASALANEADTLAEAVRGAVLATQALEILGARTPTLSLYALSLKHRFEVSAECHFTGVEYHLSVRERLIDIERNLLAMAYWLHPDRKAYFVLNAQAHIVTELIPIFSNHGAFEDAEECRNKLRSLNNKIGFHSNGRRRRLLHLLARPFNAYMDWVLQSSWHFISTIVLAFAAFVLAFHFIEGQSALEAVYSTMRAMLAEVPDWDSLGKVSAETTIGAERSVRRTGQLSSLVLNCLAAGFGLLNFGLLLSHLYNRIARK